MEIILEAARDLLEDDDRKSFVLMKNLKMETEFRIVHSLIQQF